MRPRTIYHFQGSTYADEVHDFLASSYPDWKWIKTTDSVPKNATVLLSPSPQHQSLTFLLSLPHETQAYLLLDYGHRGFDDYTKLVNTSRLKAAFAPFPVPKLKTIIIPSLSTLMVSATSSEAINHRDLFYVSQPLVEDQRGGVTQFELLNSLLTLAENENSLVYFKRHPRETLPLPQIISHNSRLRHWERSIEAAYQEFHRWFGLNSMPLFTAKSLGREVCFWNEIKGWERLP